MKNLKEREMKIDKNKFIFLYKLGKLIITLGILMWISETIYFGLNLYPMSNIEKDLDFFCNLLIIVGMGIYSSPIIILYDKFIRNLK